MKIILGITILFNTAAFAGEIVWPTINDEMMGRINVVLTTYQEPSYEPVKTKVQVFVQCQDNRHVKRKIKTQFDLVYDSSRKEGDLCDFRPLNEDQKIPLGFAEKDNGNKVPLDYDRNRHVLTLHMSLWQSNTLGELECSDHRDKTVSLIRTCADFNN